MVLAPRKRQRCQLQDDTSPTLRCAALNNEALLLAARGDLAGACKRLESAMLISPPGEVSQEERRKRREFFRASPSAFVSVLGQK